MDWNTIISLVGSLGFPIVMCIMLYNRMNEQDDRHKEEMDKMAESINNNTLAITQLTSKLDSLRTSE